MSALYDDDGRDLDEAVQAFLRYQREGQAIQDAATAVLAEVREYLVAVAVARFTGVDDTPTADALNGYVARLLTDEHGAEILAKAFYDAVWCGGRGVEREARRRLTRLRDVADDGIVAAVFEQGLQL